jgi:hypothetical protein
VRSQTNIATHHASRQFAVGVWAIDKHLLFVFNSDEDEQQVQGSQ